MTVRYPRAVYPTPTRAEPESGENLTAGETSLSVCGRRLRCVEGGLAGTAQAVAREFDQVVADHRDVDQCLELARLERRPGPAPERGAVVGESGTPPAAAAPASQLCPRGRSVSASRCATTRSIASPSSPRCTMSASG